MPLPLEQIGTVDPRRLNSDEDFARTRSGNRPGSQPEHFRSARLCDLDIAHALRNGTHGTLTSFAVEIPRSKKGLKSVCVSKGSTPSRRFSHATLA